MNTTQEHPPPATPSPFDALTPRELEVATRLATGATNREIADEFDISVKTVDTHRGHVLTKVGARNNVTLAHLALRFGLITLNEA